MIQIKYRVYGNRAMLRRRVVMLLCGMAALGLSAEQQEAKHEESKHEETPRDARVSIQQLPAAGNGRDLSMHPITVESGKRKMAVTQVPGDQALPEGSAAPEEAMVRAPESPDARLLAQVKEVWRSLYAQGVQITPELIAAEIGPANLGRLLEQHPGVESLLEQGAEAPEAVLEKLDAPALAPYINVPAGQQ